MTGFGGLCPGHVRVVTDGQDSDATRIALAMIRADWQHDEQSWAELWAVADDPAAVARALTALCREKLDQLASVAGVSTGEMLHRMASKVIPHPEAGQISVVNLPAAPLPH